MSTKKTFLTISLGHPRLSKGGAETAAYNLFLWYARQPDCARSVLLCRSGQDNDGKIWQDGDNEFLWNQKTSDWFRFESEELNAVTEHLRAFLLDLRPDVVHVHHYAHIGIETLRVIKSTLPDCRLVLTFHEYQAICHRQGQMLKTGSNDLCHRSSPEACHACFPHISEARFWTREQVLKEAFSVVDEFISPSKFLRDRYVEWGLPPQKFSVRENEQIAFPPLPPRALKEGETRNRFAFFGQVNPYKGMDILLRALRSMEKKDRKTLHVEIHGANLDLWDQGFQRMIKELAAPLLKERCLRWVGPYEQRELPARMANIDWVVVPSIWWENSPMVIQEAKNLGRRLIVSNIGGMAEKVTEGVDGHHFIARNFLDLAAVMSRAKLESWSGQA